MNAASATAYSCQDLLGRMAEARARTDELFARVRPEAIYDRPIPERHRIVFYVGHLEAFDWNLLARYALGLTPFHPEFDRLFAFGIDPVDGGLPSDQPGDWPRLDQVRPYNAQVRRILDAHLASALSKSKDHTISSTLLNVAIEHRLMHAETLAYLLQHLPLDRKMRPKTALEIDAPPGKHRMVEVAAGTATLGIPRNGAFGWDNEFEAQQVFVPAFRIDAFNVTNGDFREFVRQGGYAERSLWKEADWEWLQAAGVQHPKFWLRRGDAWWYRAMFEEIPLPLAWPVYVSHAEASAYARWAGKGLPTEAQFHRAAFGTPEGAEREYPWGSEAPARRHGNFDFGRWDPVPVGAGRGGESAWGVADLVGNGWEWTSTVFEPFPGFDPFPFYRGYSANFFDGKHYVVKGGSARTAACMLRRSFRNWFQPHYPYVYASFRGVKE